MLTEVDDQRKVLESRIRHNGGTILPSIVPLSSLPSSPSHHPEGGKEEEEEEEEEEELYQGVVVVAGPTGYRKLKYMWALASGVPLLHTEWVDACIAEQRRLPFFGWLEGGKEGGRGGGKGNYALPAGLSLLEERFIFRPPSPRERARPDPLLKGKCVVFCCSDASFGKEWKAVFRAAGAREAEGVGEIDGEWLRGHRVDYLVGDHSWPKQLQLQQQQQGGREGMELALVKTLLLRGQARLVSFDFIVQCFVHGRMLETDESARFGLDWKVDVGTGELMQEGGGREGGGIIFGWGWRGGR